MCESIGHCNCLCESISLQSLCWFFNYFVWIIIIVCVVWYAKSSINFWPMLKPYFLVVLDFLLFCLNFIIVVCVVWYDKWKEDKKNVWRIFGHILIWYVFVADGQQDFIFVFFVNTRFCFKMVILTWHQGRTHVQARVGSCPHSI